tara:strand:+ start:839 stop:2122 length:1284 start_codon:yes stop_codon:yes gene_type:complete
MVLDTLKNIQEGAEKQACNLVGIKSFMGLVFFLVILIASCVAIALLPIYKEVEGQILSGQDSHTLETFNANDVSVRADERIRYRKQSIPIASHINNTATKTVQERYTVYVITITGNQTRTLECERNPKPMEDGNFQFAVDVNNNAIDCPKTNWNNASLTVLYNNQQYNVVKPISTPSLKIAGSTDKFYYNEKRNQLIANNWSLIPRYGAKFGLGISIYSLIFTVIRLVIIFSMNGCNYKFPDNIVEKCPKYVEYWQKAFKMDKAQASYDTIAGVTENNNGRNPFGLMGSVVNSGSKIGSTYSQLNEFYYDIMANYQLWKCTTGIRVFLIFLLARFGMWGATTAICGFVVYRIVRTFLDSQTFENQRVANSKGTDGFELSANLQKTIIASVVAVIIGFILGSFSITFFNGFLRKGIGLSFIDYPRLAI